MTKPVQDALALDLELPATPSRPSVAEVLEEALQRRREQRTWEEPEARELRWVRCPSCGAKHWAGLSACPCSFRATGAPAQVLAYGSRARREARLRRLVGERES